MDEILQIRLDLDEAITYGDLEKAKKLADSGLALSLNKNNSAEAEYFKGQIEILNENYLKAIEHFDQAVKYNSKDGASYNDRALCMVELGVIENAFTYFDKGIEAEPDFATIYHNKGWLLNKIGRYDEAIECFKKALELDPNKAVTYENLADSHYKKGDKKTALECLNEALNLLNPEYLNIREELLERTRMIEKQLR